MKIIDLSHTIVNRMQVFPGDEPPMLHKTHSLEFDGYTNYQLTIGMHAGTHVDGPLHMSANNRLICDVPVESFIGKACVIDISKSKIFADCDLVKEKASDYSAVLFYTGHSAFFGTPQYLKDFPMVDDKVAQTLVDIGIKLFGIDTLTPDDRPYRFHKILFDNNILIAENLTNLEQLLPHKEITFIALPLKIQADSAPARVVAMVE
jgi:kynurenine formamidase